MLKITLYNLLALLLLWLLLWLLAQKAERAAEAAGPPRGQIIKVNGTDMHVVVTGREGAPDLVLIHGSNGHTRDMTFSLAGKLAADYRIYIIDRPGLGYSAAVSPKGDSLRAQAAQMADTAEAMGTQKPVVMGHSYGGSVALAWAVYMPERLAALVPVAAASHPWESALDPLYQAGSNPLLGPLFLPLLPAVISEARIESILQDVFTPDAVPEGYFDYFVPKLSLRYTSMRATSFQRANLLSEIKEMAPLYPQMRLPVEIVHGTDDITVGLSIHSEPLLNDIPDAVLTRAAGHGHMVQHSSESTVIAAIHRAAARAGLRPHR
ncbi:alpha/beta fold hydrolase [Lentibacter sp. XHP0401]|uniref:alpha/beta fold hydrolase n=1 Tax=Lentibacter sp. XHP0401 TaxID=2984334 RepID=UPI0021E7F67C|nr:alpha/beta hydrolase [Lentibacter sp. XHP0401]MCV2892310.1 alpha/beta hydrolase [Lentibacter sp. XHP0401]